MPVMYQPSGLSKFHFLSSEKTIWSHSSFQAIVSWVNDVHCILFKDGEGGLTSFAAYCKLPACLIMLQIVFLQTFKLVCYALLYYAFS